jgi:alpha-tubulin suppressor-like RCC1 family protein
MPANVHGRQRRRPAARALAALATTATAAALVVAMPTVAFAAQNSLELPGGGDYVTMGANGTLVINGTISYDDHCQIDGEGGVDDFFYPATDVYIVPAGSAVDGAELHDVNGQPNTIVATGSGAFSGELIGVAPPTGMLGDGEYDIVYDTCQDGRVSESDEVYSDAIVVDVADGQLPPVDASIKALKDKARQEYVSWLQMHIGVTALFKISDAKEIAACILEANPECLLQILEGIYGPDDILSQVGDRIQDQTLALIANRAANYGAIWQDPADPDFDHLPVVEPHGIAPVPAVGRPLPDAFVALAPSLQQEDALGNALLRAIERYQGAEAKGDAQWALVQARAVRDLSAALDAHLAADRTVPALRAAVAAQLPALTAQVNAGADLVERVRTSGFTAAERRALANRGLTADDVRGLEDAWVAGGPARHVTEAALIAPFDAVVAADLGMRTALQETTTGWDGVVTGLEARVTSTHPEADAGGPYATTTHSVTLDATGSKKSAASALIRTYAWDLDGDGQFDDATGAHPTVTLESSRTVTLQVTDDNGGTANDVAFVDVNAADGPPAISAKTPATSGVTVPVGTTQSFSVTSSATSFRWEVGGQPSGTSGQLAYTPTAADVGQRLVSVTATGPHGSAVRTWAVSVVQADSDGDGWTATPDCDDTRADVHPGGLERIGNGLDDDCDAASPDGPSGGPTGTLQSWGHYVGTGTGSFNTVTAPTTVNLGQPVRSVESGFREGFAVLEDRTVRSWGLNFDGVLGDGTVDTRRIPVTVHGLDGAPALTSVKQVAADETTALALRTDGSVVAWGGNLNSQLGDRSTVASRPEPVRVLGPDSTPITGVAQVETGETTSYAVMNDGTVRNWGVVHCNGQGGVTTRTSSADPAPQFGTGVVQLASGDGGGAVLRKSDGSLWTCGDFGPLLGRGPSYGTASSMRTPMPVPGWGAGSGVVDVAYGSEAAAALKDDGSVWVWGQNLNHTLDVLGLASGAAQYTPARVPLPAGPPVVAIESDYASTIFATRADGSVLVWGANVDGGGGTGSPDYAIAGTPQLALAGRAVQVSNSMWNGLALIQPADDPTWERPAQWVTASVGDAEITEGTTGSAPLTLSEPAPYDLTITYAVGDGPRQTAPVAKGSRTADLPVTAPGDALDSDDRQLPLQVLAVSHDVDIVNGAATITVHDDDAAPTVSVGDVTVAEGDTSLNDVTVPVTLAAPSGNDVQVDWTATDGTAAAPGDYRAAHGTALFPAGETEALLHLSVVGDAVVEPQEQLSVTLSDPIGTTVADGTSTVTITDDEPLRLDVASPQVVEGDTGTTPATFTVSTPALPEGTSLTVPWSVKAGTAQVGSDVQDASGTVTLTPEQLSQQVSVQVVADNAVEPVVKETFTLALGRVSSSDGRQVLLSEAPVAVITDDDHAPTVSAGPDASGSEGSAVTIIGTASASATWSVADPQCTIAAPASLATTVACPDETDTVLTLTASDGTNPAVSDRASLHVTNAAPSLVISSPAAGTTAAPGQPVSLTATVSDPGTSDTVSCAVAWGDGTTSTGCTGSHSWAAAGTYAVTVTADDGDGGQTVRSITVTVKSTASTWPWGGFYAPVDNQPVVNVVQAGSTVPVKFSLGGDRGLGIFAQGYPQSAVHACAGTTLDALESTSTPGEATLVYDAASGRYHYNWKTQKAWAGTCRTLVLKLTDGTTHTAEFRMR